MSDIQEQIDLAWEEHDADSALIEAYVPEADLLTWDEALKLAEERAQKAAQALQDSDEPETTMKELDARYLKELGFG